MNEQRPRHSFYRCIQCHGDLAPRAGGVLACGGCGATYPSVGGVRLFTSSQDHLLRSQLSRLAGKRAEITQAQASLAGEAGGTRHREALSIAHRGYAAQLANLDVLDRAMAPVEEYLAARGGRASLFDDIHLADAPWFSFDMLEYFYRDWGQTEEARFLTDLFAGAIGRYCGADRRSVAVLGCGAGRLVYDLAELFPVVFGLDLAVDCLLLAKRLLDGAEIELHFNFPSAEVPWFQEAVELKGPAPRRAGIELVAASVNRLPFASRGIACVVTPYLLDLMPNVDTVVSEIRRVLAPGGVWINFCPITGRAVPQHAGPAARLNRLDLPSFLQRSGFALLDQQMHRFTFLDLSPVSDWAATVTQTPVFFAARKDASRDAERRDPRDPVAEYFAGQGESIWAAVPKISTYVALIQERVFTGQGVEELARIAIYSSARSLPIPDRMAVVVERLLRGVDGIRTTRDVFARWREEHGDLVAADEFVRLLGELQRLELLEIQTV